MKSKLHHRSFISANEASTSFIFSVIIVTLFSAVSTRGQGAIVEPFDAGLGIVTSAAPTDFGNIQHSGVAGGNRVPLSGAAWEASPFYSGGFLNGPSGVASDGYLWNWDNIAGTEFFGTTISEGTGPLGTMSFQFIDSLSTNGAISLTFPRVIITNSAETVSYVALASVPMTAGIWNTVTIPFDVTGPGVTWYHSFPTDSNNADGSQPLLTQAELNSIILGSGWKVRFGAEGITGNTGPTGPEFMAVDNFTYTPVPVPEPSAVFLGSVAAAFMAFRRRSRD